MEMTLPLWSICSKWLTALEQSNEIQEFCQANYGRAPIFLGGANPRQAPDEDFCPYILVMPGRKSEGSDPLIYTVGVAWVIAQPNVLVDGVKKPFNDYSDAKEIIISGMRECDEFGQMIFEVLQTCAEEIGYPISKIEYDISPVTAFPQFAGVMLATTNIEPAMGEILAY